MRTIALAVMLLVSAAACGGDDDGVTPGDGGMRADASARVDGGTPPPRDGGVRTDGSIARDAGPGTDGGLSFACTTDELSPIADCAVENCAMLPDGGLPSTDDLIMCVVSSCGALLLGLSPDCRDCLITAAGMNLDEILMSCADGVPAAP